MSDTPYVPPKVWTWQKANGGRFANINRPVAGATHELELPRGKHPCNFILWVRPMASK